MLNALQMNKKIYTLSTFLFSNRRNFEDSGKVLAVSVSECYQSIVINSGQKDVEVFCVALVTYKLTII